MAYKFRSKLENIFKILETEDKISENEIIALKNSINDMDKLKKTTNAPIKYSQFLWDKLEEVVNLEEQKVLQAIIKLENACVLADQYLEFVKTSKKEIALLAEQIKIQTGLQDGLIDDCKGLGFVIPLSDCNEIFRYITVWDDEGFINPKYNACIKSNFETYYAFNDAELVEQVQKFGYAQYVTKLRELYNGKVNEVCEQGKDFYKEYDKVKDDLLKINKALNYTHYVPFNYNDGTRQPIGHDNDTKHQEAMNKFYKEYELQCKKSKDNDLSR